MSYIRTKRIIGLVVMLTFVAIASTSIPAAPAGEGTRSPELPSPLCDKVQTPAGNEVAFHVYARGVQIYRWDGLAWQFVAPVATLFADAGYNGQVGIHYAGPSWETNSGSKVTAARVDGCSPNPTAAIPWLLLRATSTNGPGVLSSVTYIHRVNTMGGLPPALPGSIIGESTEIPYTAEYYFYREQN